MGCRLPVGVTRAAARAGWTGSTGCAGCRGWDLANVVWKRDSAVVLGVCLCLCLLGRVGLGLGAVVGGVLGLAGGRVPSWTSPMSLLVSRSVSRLNISSLRGSCLRGSSVSRGTGEAGLEVVADVAANVGKKGVAVVEGEGSVGTRSSDTVGRNTDELSSSKLTSSSSSEL